MLISWKPCEIERFQQNFWLQSSYPNFQKKNFSRQKWRPFWIFEFFAEIAKHKSAYILKTVLDRGISTKFFFAHRVSLQSSHPNFQKKFVSPKMAAILNFLQKLQNAKMLISRKPYYIERFQQNFWPTGYLCRVAIPVFKKKISRQKWQQFSIF